jgi:opacity protein-like surface antigen
MRKTTLLATSVFLALGVSAHAADLSVAPLYKAAPVAAVNCSVQGCAYFGAAISESGGSFNVISTGVSGLTDNNLNLAVEGGYDYFSGNIYLGANAMFEYGLIQNGIIPGGGNSELWGGGVWAKIGYNVASALGLTPATATNPISSLFATTTPYVDLGIWDRPWGDGFASGGGAMGWVTPNVSLHVDYLHVDYNNASVNANVNQQTEDMVIGGLDYHFAF